jgi:hypothetical protein
MGMRASIWKFAKILWLPVSLGSTWIGIFFMPQDIADLPAAAMRWGFVMEYASRESLFVVYSFLLTVYVCVRYVLPYFWGWWNSKRHPIRVWQDAPILRSNAVNFSWHGGGDNAFRIKVFIRVSNNRKDGKELSNVKTELRFSDYRYQCSIDGQETSASIPHGHYEDFFIGSFFETYPWNYMHGPQETMEGPDAKSLIDGIKSGERAFVLPDSGQKRGLSLTLKKNMGNTRLLEVVISASSVLSQKVIVVVSRPGESMRFSISNPTIL